MRRSIYLCALSLSVISGCAGPMTPFGAMDVFNISFFKAEVNSRRGPASEEVKIQFAPQRQLLHDQTEFSITITDAQGILSEHDFHLTYNGIDVTRKFLAGAQVSYLDREHHQLKFTTRHLRLLPGRDNKVIATYKHSPPSVEIAMEYQKPECLAFSSKKPLHKVGEFQTAESVIALINRLSVEKSLNPNYVAGLIAEESAFDSRAVSSSRAIGLTQVTTLSEAEILKNFPDLPRYEGIASTPLPLLRLKVIQGEINSSNEWRLNPELSIRGGVNYISSIAGYWNRQDKQEKLQFAVGTSEKNLSELILASYNFGPARVSQAIERSGRDWLADDEIQGAKAYVGKIVSFCDQFENQQEVK